MIQGKQVDTYICSYNINLQSWYQEHIILCMLAIAYTVKCKLFMVENFRAFHGLASNCKSFPANFFFIIRCFELLYNHKSFPANNKKIMQLRNFSTANNLHYTVHSHQHNNNSVHYTVFKLSS